MFSNFIRNTQKLNKNKTIVLYVLKVETSSLISCNKDEINLDGKQSNLLTNP